MASISKHHLGKASFVMILIEALKKDGVNVQALRNKCALKYFRLNDPEAMLPIPVIYEFFELVENTQGIDKMGVKFQKYFTLDNIGVYGQLLSNSKKVLPAILFAQKYEKFSFTHDSHEFKILDGTTAFYGNRYITKPSKGQDFLSKLDHGIILELAKNSNVEGWCPKEIHVIGDDASYVENMFPFSNPKILLNQEKYGLVFNTKMLSNKILSDKKISAIQGDINPIPDSLSAKIELLLDNLTTKNLPIIEEISNMFNISVSSLKRKLQEEDMSFSKLLERWRFMKAVELLSNTNLKIKEISDQLFYSNPSNFVRAFRSSTGFSPNSLRT